MLQGSWVPVETSVSDTVHGESSHDKFIDVALTVHGCASKNVMCIVFQNSYTAYITCEQRISTSGDHVSSRVILSRYGLMCDSNCEDDAQAWHAVYSSQFGQPVLDCEPPGESQQIDLRIYLIQPSPNWPKYGLRHIRVHTFVPLPVCLSASPDNSPRSFTRFFQEADDKLQQLKRLSCATDDSKTAQAFTVEIRRKPGQTLGVVLGPDLEIRSIEVGGLVSTWNATADVSNALHVGDRVVELNGERGYDGVHHILAMSKEHLHLKITLHSKRIVEIHLKPPADLPPVGLEISRRPCGVT